VLAAAVAAGATTAAIASRDDSSHATAPTSAAPPAITTTAAAVTTTTTTPPPAPLSPTSVAPAPPPVTAAPASPAAVDVVARVIDGDTVVLATGDHVRLIGIDTPEQGHCGYDEASAHLRSLVAGRAVTLTAGARDDVDVYGRRLRYVDLPDGTDAGLAQITGGFAVARYDSRDGYGHHPREEEYVAADQGAAAPCVFGTSAPTTIAPGATGGGRVAPDADGNCPADAPIKGNASSHIYHRPGQRSYAVTKAEDCFATGADAEAAGYRAAKR
jgi:endonuclease YncB( thermonuclease family)